MFGIGVIELIVALTAVALALYYYSTSTYDFWSKRNISGPEPVPFFGNFIDIILLRTSISEFSRDLYANYSNEPVVGIYEGKKPILMIRDPEILRHIFIKDFSTFSDRGTPVNEKIDPLSAHLVYMDGHRWKGLRSKLSPVFTSGKLRLMFDLLLECADQFEKYTEELVTKGKPIECRDLTANFTTDVIGSCAFGINMNALSSTDSEFRKMGRKYLAPSLFATLRRILRGFFPNLYLFLRLRSVPKDITDFFMKITKETMDFRKANGINRHDFIDLLMQIRANPDETDFELTDSLIAAQAFVFFLAGFETSSTTISFALYELALAQEIQDKLRAEIRETLKKCDGKLTYEIVKGMEYLDMVFRETLRKNPPVLLLMRKSVKEYVIPDTKIHLPAGQTVMISVLGLHYDPEHYPNPELFDPERFNEEAKQARHSMTYLPFGEGPRHCIGARFGTFQTKVGIIKVLQHYRVTPCEKTDIPYVIDKKSFLLSPVGGIYLNFTKVN